MAPLLVGCPSPGGEVDSPPDGAPIADVATKLTGDGAFGPPMVGTHDLSGDGVADLAVGASLVGDDRQGEVLVYCGPVTTGLSTDDACATVQGEGTFYYGTTVAITHDVDGDGVEELAIGESYNYPTTTVGLFPLPLEGARSSEDAAVVISDDGHESAPWVLLASTLDSNGDGYGELIVSHAHHGDDAGVVFIFDGPLETTTLDTADGVIRSTHHQNLGQAIANVGDTDGDGVDDLLLGADRDSRVAVIGGAVWLFRGPITGELTDDDADLALYPDDGGRQVGWDVDGAGDVTGDGLADLLVGALAEDEIPGGAYVWEGDADGINHLEDAAAWLYCSDPDDTELGISVAGLGDLDGDGHPDLMVGVKGDSEGGRYAGAAWVVRGPVEGASPLAWRTDPLIGTTHLAEVGADVAPAGDLDGDGLPDALVAATGSLEDAVYILRSPGSWPARLR